MRLILLFSSIFFIATSVNAQSTSSLNITLTDIQSVRISAIEVRQDRLTDTKQMVPEGTVQVLNLSSSTVKKISQDSAEYEKLYNEFYSTSAGMGLLTSANSVKSLQETSLQDANHVIYQIDPR